MDPLAVAHLLTAAFVAAVGAMLLTSARRSLATWTLLVLTFAFAAVVALRGWLYGRPEDMVPIGRFLGILMPTVSALALGFVVAYPPRPLRTLTRWLYVWALLPGLFFIVVFQTGPVSDLTAAIFAVFRTLGGAASIAVFGWRWLRAPDGPFRKQLGYVLVAFILWAVNDGLPVALGIEPLSHPVARVLEWVALIGAGCLAAVAVVRSARGRSGDIIVALAVVVALAAASAQFLGPYHLLVDGLFYAVLVYGFAKYQVLDVDLRVKRGFAKTVVAACALTALVLVEEVVQGWVDGTFGFAAGVAIALGLTFARPLHRVAGQLSDRVFPRVGTPAYLERRRLELYRAALEGSLRDGRIEPRESAVLAALRRELRVTDDEHETVTRALASVPPTPTPAL